MMDIRKFFGVVSAEKKSGSGTVEKKEKTKSAEDTSDRRKINKDIKVKSSARDDDSKQKKTNRKRVIFDSDSDEEEMQIVKKSKKPPEKSLTSSSKPVKDAKREPVIYVSETDDEDDFIQKKKSQKPKENGTSMGSCTIASGGGLQAETKTQVKTKPPSPVKLTPTSALDYFGTGSVHRSDKKLVATKRKIVSGSTDAASLNDEAIAKQLQLEEDAELERQLHEDDEFARTLAMLDEMPKNKKLERQLHEDDEFARTLAMLDEMPKNKKPRKDAEKKSLSTFNTSSHKTEHRPSQTARTLHYSEETKNNDGKVQSKAESSRESLAYLVSSAARPEIALASKSSPLKTSSKLALLKEKEDSHGKDREPSSSVTKEKAVSSKVEKITPKKEKISPRKSESKSPEESEKKRVNFQAYRNFLNREGPKALGSKEIPQGAENCLEGMTFVITGVLESIERDEAKSLIERYGGKVTGNVSKKTNYLVMGRDSGQSKKEKAESLRTEILNEDGLFNLIRTAPGKKSKYEIMAEAEGIQTKGKLAKTPEKTELGGKEVTPTKREAESKKNLLGLLKKEAPDAENELALTEEKQPVLDIESFLPAPSRGKTESLLWVDKYKPTSIKAIIGQQGDQSCANKLTRWLRNWHNNNALADKKPAGKFSKLGSKDDGSSFKAALLSGPPGVGKTTTASLVCEELGYSYVELNASDTRSKTSMKEIVAESLSNTSIKDFCSGTSQSVSMNHVLIMDEVDGMAGNEDRGGIQELIGLIKQSKIPIICMCNDRNHQKIRSLANYCFDLRFHRPRVEQIKGAMMSIAYKEGLKIPPPAMNEIILAANQDIRQVLHNLSMWCVRTKSLNYDQAKDDASRAKKDIKLGPFDVVRKVFTTGEETAHMTLVDKLDLFFHDYSLGPLFVQENYLYMNPAAAGGNMKKHLLLLSRTADSICDGDLVDRQIRSKQTWSLLPTQAIYASVIPGELMRGYMSLFPCFPNWLGRYSSTGKHNRILQELSMHMCLRTHASKGAVNMDYLSHIRDALVRPLASRGVEGVQDAVGFMDTYHLMKEDVENIMDTCSWGGKPSPFSKLDSKVKAAFTRCYNREAHLTPYSLQIVKASKRGAGTSLDLELNEELNLEESQSDDKGDDIEVDAMIKTRKVKSTKMEKNGETKKVKGKGKKIK
ncbi:replication factor C subunit 1 [Rhinatrema bivittatum]|uniref:replication factor C subunit 1 n=1 Tax=Rhinatrema bivittatum TaxID=194408 RepID=UPI001127E2F7|nr:replication factor C subunit 1 [Rhinatrema bivittatum]